MLSPTQVALQVAREPELVEAPREATINREEWVNIFVGPPCNVDSCVELIMRKNQQGRYLISDEDHVAYKRLDKKIRAEYKETQVR
jgi:osmotically-inducible protein OsmY